MRKNICQSHSSKIFLSLLDCVRPSKSRKESPLSLKAKTKKNFAEIVCKDSTKNMVLPTMNTLRTTTTTVMKTTTIMRTNSKQRHVKISLIYQLWLHQRLQTLGFSNRNFLTQTE